MFPSHVDGGSHTVRQDDELRRPAIVMGAEAHDVDLSHSGRKIARKLGKSKGAAPYKAAVDSGSSPVIRSADDPPRDRAKDG
jgi:hypothetical protein